MPKYDQTTFYYHPWIPSEEAKMTAMMEEGTRKRIKTRDLFEKIGQELERTPFSCKNHWYSMQKKLAKEDAQK